MKRILSEQGYQTFRGGPDAFGLAAFCCALAFVPLLDNARAADNRPVPNGATPQFSPIDLSGFYTSGFSNNTSALAGLPQGRQMLGGVPFVIGGKVEVTGTDAARHGEFLPPQISGIPINQKALRIELLHGARHGQKDGTPLGNVILHFKNGATRKVRLAFGVHARNYLEEISSLSTTQSVRALADPNSLVVWHNDPKTTNEPMARLYRTSLDNPLPDQEIATLDFISLFNRATPVVFAITLQSSGATPVPPTSNRKAIQRASQFEDSVYRADLKVRVTDASDGKPVPNATAILTIKDDSRSFFFGQYKSDTSGQIDLSYPPQQTVSLSVRVSSPGYVPGSALLSSSDSQKWPESLNVALKHGSPIGGLIVNSSGKPIPGATVIPCQITQTRSNEYTRTDFDMLKTGPDGKWIGTAESESLSNLSFEIKHPEFHSAFYKQLSAADLLRTNARVTLDPHIQIVGRVVANGAPVTNATVMLDATGDSRNVESRSVESDGRFSFIVRDPTNNTATVIATAPNYAPALYSVSLSPPAAPLTLALDPGSTLKMKFVDQNDIPVAGVKVTLQRWQGSQALQWRTVSDDQGGFVWNHAPSGSVTFRYEKTGHSTHTHSMTLPAPEQTFTYSRMNRIYGKVVDAETKKPIDQFTYAFRYRYLNNTPKRWYRYTSGTGRNGAFSSSSMGGISQAEWSLVIEARGYDPAVTNLSLSGVSTNTFELKKGTPLVGAVVTSNGTPVPKADVVLLDATTSASMDVPGKIRKTSSYYDIVLSDANGRFELTRKPEPDMVIATHSQFGYGELPLDVFLKTGKITLQPWGYVRGVLRVGDKIEPYQHIALHSNYQMDDSNGRSQPGLYVYYKGTPDANGRFSFDMVPPGNRVVYLHYQLQERESGTMKLSHNVSVVVKPGETNDVVIGGNGRMVTGKVKTSGANVEVDWHRDSHTMRLINPPPGVPPPVRFPPNATAEERQKLIKERNAALQAFYREQNRRNSVDQHVYVLLFNDDGSFWVPNVPAGRYNIYLSPTDPRQPNNYRQLGNMNSEVVVPEGSTPHDIGTLNLTLRPQ